MRVLKWLFHPVYLLLIIVIFALYVNRDVLFSDEVAESLEVEALVGKMDELTERLRSDTEGEPATAPLETAESEAVNESSDDVAEVAEVASSPALEPAEAVSEEPAPVADVVAAVSKEEPTALQSEPQLEPARSEPEPAQPETMAIQEEVTDEPAVASPLSIWRAARTAVWQGDLNAAVDHYRQLIAQQPNNYDAYGEMGNVLLAQSDVTAAVEAYVTAARLIRQSGNQQMARRLVGVVGSLDEAQGQALYNEFFQ